MRTGRRHLYLYILALLALIPAASWAAPAPVAWSARLEPAGSRAGEQAQVVVEARIDPDWHVYGTVPPKDVGPRPTSVSLVAGPALTASGKVIAPPAHRELDPGFKIEVEYYEGGVAFGLPVRLAAPLSGAQKAAVKVQYMVCKEGSCLPPKTLEVPVTFTVAPGAARPERANPVTAVPAQPAGYVPPGDQKPDAPAAAGPLDGQDGGAAGGADQSTAAQIDTARSRGLLAFLGLALTMGFLALLTPCVFPMVPITVSFFSKQHEHAPGSALRSAVAYCLGIIGTFTGLGLLVSVLFGAAKLSYFAAHPITNLILGGLFVVMALNLFGVFEIILPGWLVARSQAGSQRAGFLGPILMGLTFTLTSFTCTFAFVGTLLVSTARGDYLWPVLGMLAFSTAFASPFFLLALFPQYLARMPRSGSWLVTVKGYMGFLELAAALKFLSNADLVWHLGLLTRPVFVSLWFAIFAVAGTYLLGWLRLPHDSSTEVGPLRRVLGLATVVAGCLLLTILNGKSLGLVNGFLPPRVYPGTAQHAMGDEVPWLENYEQAVARAKAERKPIFIDFTGVTCTNCRVMEDTVFTLPEVNEEFKKFVTVRLYTDKDTPESLQYQKMQEERFGETTLPLYVVETADGRTLDKRDYNPDPAAFVAFLRRSHALSTSNQVARTE